MGINPENLYVTVFKGDPKVGIGRDEESIGIWEKLFKKRKMDPRREEDGERYGLSRGGRIFCMMRQKIGGRERVSQKICQ